ncbi:MAG: NTP transferase domain-containing protein [Selenomonadaceae bacterium]|nr:NTP transferase domain-containing protein [Selenomonadaceae bacterium]
MKPKYIIVQAGGKGSRMETLTQNKPKALVPVENLPMIFHLFKKFPDKKYLIIGDYKEDVLRRYLSVFADADYRVVSANGRKGTVAGIKDAMSFIPSGESFMLIWCDLILGDDDIPDIDADVIGIAKNFSCRWSYMHTPPPVFCTKKFQVAA